MIYNILDPEFVSVLEVACIFPTTSTTSTLSLNISSTLLPSVSVRPMISGMYHILLNVHSVSDPCIAVSGIGVLKISTKFLIAWTPQTIQNTVVSQYNVTYYNITCPSEQQSSQSSSVTVNSPSTSTLVSLQSGQLYNISVRAINALGQSSAVSISYWTPASQGESTNIVSTPVNNETFSSQCSSGDGKC